MSNQLPVHVARFEAVQMPDGWTVVDLAAEQVIRTRQLWSEDDATLVADALTETPAYALLWKWETPESYPGERWDVLAKPLPAFSLDGRTMTTLPAGTMFDLYAEADGAGRVSIAAFTPDGSPCLWLVDDAALRAAAVPMPGGREAVA